ncbi:MAG: AAA family ATPase, partial [Deltaproteobacteria bacterium]|nr:AAA family ATPase [Deltaproteobacteria bacterium]
YPDLPDWFWSLVDNRDKVPPLPEIMKGDGFPSGVARGRRNDTAARLAGRYLAKGLSVDETITFLLMWNQKNNPPLQEKEIRSVVFSIASRERKNRPSLEIVDAKDLSSGAGASPEMIIEPFLPRGGKGILAGSSGTGKTLLALNIAYSIANEIPLFGRFSVKGGRVLYVDAESTRDLVRHRTERIRRGLDAYHADVSLIFPPKTLDLGVEKNREELCRQIEQHGFALVILDSFLCFAALRNENDNPEVRRWLEDVADIPRKTGASLLILD